MVELHNLVQVLVVHLERQQAHLEELLIRVFSDAYSFLRLLGTQHGAIQLLTLSQLLSSNCVGSSSLDDIL